MWKCYNPKVKINISEASSSMEVCDTTRFTTKRLGMCLQKWTFCTNFLKMSFSGITFPVITRMYCEILEHFFFYSDTGRDQTSPGVHAKYTGSLQTLKTNQNAIVSNNFVILSIFLTAQALNLSNSNTRLVQELQNNVLTSHQDSPVVSAV